MKCCLKTLFYSKKPKDCRQYNLNAGNTLRKNDRVICVIHYTTFVGKLREQ